LGEVSLHLLEEEEWDFFMVVFMGTDRIQHFFWKYVDEGHPEHEESEYGVMVKEYYKKIDKIIDKFLDAAPKDTLTILLSDHGFCPIKRELLVNKYLKEQGILKIRDGKVDLERSRAVSYGYGDIWLNVKGREPKGIIKREGYAEATKEIIHVLEQLDIDGEKPIKRVMKREEIYWGPFTHYAPDLMALFKTGWQASRHLGIERAIGAEKGFVVKSPMWSGGHDGAHDPEDVLGLLAMLGSGVEEKQDIKANLYDVAPTILSLFRIPVPLGMDGIPLSFAAKE
jgi:predicted AlkP superfamily phosphohydrolase/phosphomutase